MAYSPQAPYAELKRVESFIERARTVDDLRYIAATEGNKVGYKALGRLIAGKMTPEEMKPREAKAFQQQVADPEPEKTDNGFSLPIETCLSRAGFFPEGKIPYDYQVDGIRFLATNPSALLADEMGLGKTIQAIGALKVLYELRKVSRILILCPRPLVGQWHRELTAWAPELFAQEVRG